MFFNVKSMFEIKHTLSKKCICYSHSAINDCLFWWIEETTQSDIVNIQDLFLTLDEISDFAKIFQSYNKTKLNSDYDIYFLDLIIGEKDCVCFKINKHI